ncbi:MAG: methyl-accepting chemotaxis protein [Oleiphilaceae bacterium]|jgi:nitrate/nitrite-specific signal transduction histidine kinase
MNSKDSDQHLKQSETNIRDALIAKGNTLANNNSQALKGMVEDNAFSAVGELVSSTVLEDKDIVYGIFMDVDMLPWINANLDNPSGLVLPGTIMEDSISQWAIALEELSYKAMNLDGQTVYEFAAPVVVEEELLGVIRYGITTKTMDELLLVASTAAQQTFRETMFILMGVGLIAVLVGFFSTRRIAGTITTPLNSLTSTAEKIAGGDYNNAVDVKTDDEIGILAENFETMRATIRKKMADLAKLNSTGEVLASLLDQTTALEEVLQAMHEQVGVSHGSVYLMNDQEELEIKGHYPPKSVDANKLPRRFKLGDGILGAAAQKKELIFVADTSIESDFVSADKQQKQSAKSLLCIPLVDKDILIGVMNCSGEIGEVHFEDADKEFAQAIARQLVITIKNIRMREVIEEQNRTLEQKVAERTSELAQKTNDIEKMMAHMHQGLFTVMDNGLVHHEYAKYLEEILETKQIANRNIMDLLFTNSDLGGDQLDQIKVASEAIIGEDEMMYDFNSHLLVNEYTREFKDSGQSKVIELDWDPIVLNGQIEKLMVTVRDVTEMKALQGQAEAQRQELEMIGQILAIDKSKFDEFVQSSKEFIELCRSLIAQTLVKDLDVVSSLFRNMHTVKGNARTYGFSYITDSVHEVENSYDALRKDATTIWLQAELLAGLDLVETDLNRYQTVATEKLGREETAQNGVEIDQSNIQNILEQLQSTQSLPEHIQPLFSKIFSTLIVSQAQPLSSALDDVIKSVDSLVAQLDKTAPMIMIEDADLYIKNAICPMLNNIFMHILRNAIDHGIEGADERLANGKSAAGSIYFTIAGQGEIVTITVQDDGRGLALNKIYNKALEMGIYKEGQQPTDDEVANLVFSSGFSTAQEVTQVSGRGVGMDAVKGFLEQQQGSIAIVLDDKVDQGEYRTFTTKIKLPGKLFMQQPVLGSINEKSICA